MTASENPRAPGLLASNRGGLLERKKSRTLKSEREGGLAWVPNITRRSRCAVPRHGLPVGANPTRQLSLQPVVIGAVVEVTKRLKPSV